MKFYNKILKQIEKKMGTKSTFTNELTTAGKHLLKSKYHGTYAANELPTLTEKIPYAIVNLDDRDQSGSHWIALAKVKDKIVVYDSFGRQTSKIASRINKKYKATLQTDNDVEQGILELNCGPRSLAWLFTLDQKGLKSALTI